MRPLPPACPIHSLRDEHLRPGRSGDWSELAERCRPGPGVTIRGVGCPMVIVGRRSAGEAQRLITHFRQQITRISRREVTIPDRRIATEVPRIYRAHRTRGVYRDVHRTWRRSRRDRDRVNVKCRQRRPAAILNPECVDIRLALHAKRRQWNRHLLPRIRRERRERHHRLRRAIQRRLNL